MKNAHPITPEMIARFKENYRADRSAKAKTAAASKSELSNIAFSPMDAARMEDTFSIEIKTHGVTNQKQSGRCWLFASMNVMREAVSAKCNMDKFELSGNWLAFWDKFEKMNYFLEASIDSADLPTGDRTIDWLTTGVVSDGGQWDMMVSIIKKYGIVPKSAMPETWQSTHTRMMNNMLNLKLRKDAVELRRLVAAGVDPTARKEEMLAELFKALCICFGCPPETFDFTYVDKNGTYHADYGMTAHSFYDKYVGIPLEDYVSVINSPTEDKPFDKSYTVKYLGNVVEGGVRYINLPIERLKELAIRQMKDGAPVWFGSDVSKFGAREDGIWDPDSFMYEDVLGGMDLFMDKEDRLDTHDSAMNHAMVLTGVNLDANGCSNRWKIENSWGEDAGRKGYYVCSDKWFDEFVYQVIIDKKYLSEADLNALAQPPKELCPWDPMGSLA